MNWRSGALLSGQAGFISKYNEVSNLRGLLRYLLTRHVATEKWPYFIGATQQYRLRVLTRFLREQDKSFWVNPVFTEQHIKPRFA